MSGKGATWLRQTMIFGTARTQLRAVGARFLAANRAQQLASACALALTLYAAYRFLDFVDRQYPVEDWLFWRLAAIWGYAALLNLGWFAAGTWFVTRVLKIRELPPAESAVLSMGVGVVLFVLVMYALGAVGLFQPLVVLAVPILASLGAPSPAVALVRRWRRDAVDAGTAGAFASLLQLIGVLCLGAMYLQLLTPDALNYDATWCHLTVAQDYAREGRIVPFPADYNKNVPLLASVVHTWSFLAPGLVMAERWMLVLHVEFSLVLWTLVGVNAAVRFLAGGDVRVRAAWVGFFLFANIFVYDSNIGGAADHVLAFFTLPLLLVLARFTAAFEERFAFAFGLLAAGAIWTKLQAIYVLVPSAVFMIAVWGMRWWRFIKLRTRDPAAAAALRRALVRGPLLALCVGLVAASPHYLRNALFYKNPFYPFAQDLFASQPSVPNAAFLAEYILKDFNWRPQGTWLEKLDNARELFITFSFIPHYYMEARPLPAFGSLFTLSLPLILFVRGRRRLFLGVFVGSSAVLIWALTYLVDRNLQTFAPVLVATSLALVVRAWELGVFAKVGVAALVLSQAVWAGDAVFYSGHERIRSSIDLIRSGYTGKAGQRFDQYRRDFLRIGRELPENATLLIHTSHVSLGINRRVLLDWAGFQGLIGYEGVRSARDVHTLYKRHGITHVLAIPGQLQAPSKQEEVAFAVFTAEGLKSEGNFGGHRLYKLSKPAPPEERPYRVFAYGLRGYENGLYAIERMNTIEYLPAQFQKFPKPDVPLPEDPAARAALVEAAAFAVAPSQLSGEVGNLIAGASVNRWPVANNLVVYELKARKR
jgi:hypothetical protein